MAVVGIVRLEAYPYPDRQRVRLRVEIAGDSEPPPHLELSIHDPQGIEVAEMLVMGLSDTSVELTLHLRVPARADESFPYTARGRLFRGAEQEEEETLALAEREFHLNQE